MPRILNVNFLLRKIMPKVIIDEKLIDKLMTRGVDEVIENESLKNKLMSGERLRIKFGIDPTSPDLHLGHTVPLRKLRQFQDLGHQVVLLIGDFTARIGDPSGKNETRKMLSKEDIKENLKDYQNQAAKILNMEKVEVRFNSEWYDKAGMAFFSELTSKFTVARVMERDDFKKRMKEDVDISMLELLYPLMQGYDSVVLKADLEIGGTDQKFNLLMGRKVQKRYGQKQQDILTTPLIEGLDGSLKMSKSLGNYIGITESPENMFGKIMSLPDSLIVKYFILLTDETMEKIRNYQDRIRKKEINPRDVKMNLAEIIVSMYHNSEEAKVAQVNFEKVFSRKEVPDAIEEVKIKEGATLVDFLVVSEMAKSKSDARRKIEQGGVKIEGVAVKDSDLIISNNFKGRIVKSGKRNFRKISLA
jgi:tyrosyl-tRNA synthetase